MWVIPMIVLAGCSGTVSHDKPSPPKPNQPLLAATNGALADMTRFIAGDTAEVVCPHTQSSFDHELAAAMPPTEIVLRLQQAKIVFTNGPGADDAPWLNLVSLQSDRVHATTSDEFEISDFIQVQDFAMVHSHGDQGEHSHPWLVPHCWMNPQLAAAQSVSIRNRLILEFPQHQEVFRTNQSALAKELEELHQLSQEVGQLLQARRCTTIASDPRLLFFTRALNQPDHYFLWFDLPPSPQAANALKQATQTDNTMILWAQPPGQLAPALSKNDAVVNVVIDRIETDQPQGYLQRMRDNFQAVKNAVTGATH